MNCPKCKTKMHHDRSISRASSLINRLNGMDVTPVSGHTCYNCGTWVCDEVEIAKPMPPKEDGRRVAFEPTATDLLVIKYRETVVKMCRACVGISAITRMINVNERGHGVRDAAVLKSITRLKMGVLDALQE